MTHCQRTTHQPSTDAFSRLISVLLVLAVLLVPLAFCRASVSIATHENTSVSTLLAAEYKWSKACVLNLLSALILIFAALHFLRNRSSLPRPKNAHTLIPTLFFAAVTLLSVSKSLRLTKSLEAAALVGGSLIIYLITLLFVCDVVMLRRLFVAASLAATAVAVFGLLQYFGVADMPVTHYGQQNPDSFFNLANFAAECLLIPFAMCLALVASAKTLQKLIFGAASGIMAAYLLVAENRASWVAVVVECALGVILLLVCRVEGNGGQGRMLKKPAIVAIAGVVLVSVGVLKVSRYGSRVTKRAASIFDVNDWSSQTRLLTWQTVPKMFAENPLLGIGLGNTEVLFPKYASERLTVRYLESNTKIDQVHNEYLQILLEGGILGFLAFALWVVALWRLAIFVLRERVGHHQGWYRIGLIVGIGGFLTDIFFSFGLRNPASALSFWFAVGLLEAQNPRFVRRDWTGSRAGPAQVRRLVVASGLFGLAGLLLYGAYFSGRASEAELSHLIAIGCLDLRRWEPAIRYATRAIQLNPLNEGYYYSRASAYSRLNDFAPAVADLKRCVAVAPYYERAHLALGSAYYGLRDFEDARAEFEVAEPLMRGRRAAVRNALVRVYVGLNQVDKAIEAGREAVHLDPDNPEYQFALGYAYAVGKQYQKAADACVVAMTLKPDFAEARALLDQVMRAVRSR